LHLGRSRRRVARLRQGARGPAGGGWDGRPRDSVRL